MITTKVKCEICKLDFDKSAREVRRSIKLGTPSICRNKNCKSEWGKITVKRRKKHSKGMLPLCSCAYRTHHLHPCSLCNRT